MELPFKEIELTNFRYTELQALAKHYGIRANMKVQITDGSQGQAQAVPVMHAPWL